MIGYAAIRWGRERRGAAGPGRGRDPYRDAPARAPRLQGLAAAPLSLPLSGAHWSRWILGGPFFAMGLALVPLTAILGWGSGGELGLFWLFLVALSHAVLAAGAFGLFYRSGLVLDPARGHCVRWWGLMRPWFRRYRALDALTHATAVREGSGRASYHALVIHFDDSTRWKEARSDREEASADAARVEAYLAELRARAEG